MAGRGLTVISVLGGLVSLFLFWKVFHSLEKNPTNVALVAVCGALAGALGGLVGSFITSAATMWSRDAESKQQMRNRVSTHALELTKMDYEIRLRALTESQAQGEFLAPAKVYRELYRALVLLDEKDEWPKAIEDMGLLNIFSFDPSARGRRDRAMEKVRLLHEVLGKPRADYNALQNAPQGAFDEARRRELARGIRTWQEKYNPMFPPALQESVTLLANLAGIAVVDGGLTMIQSPMGFERSQQCWSALEEHAKELERASGI